MTHKKNEAGNLLPMTVTDGATVNVLPNERHEFLLSTADVALGYGVTGYNIRMHKIQHADELVEGKHYITAVSIPNSDPTAPHNKVFWTKRGIVRLGFFIKSARARLFRDWAEELIITPRPEEKPRPLSPAPSGRRINRLTPGRVADILADVCLIKDDELRQRIAMKITGGVDYGC